MSSFVYGELTGRRQVSAPGESTKSQPPGMRTFVDALTALVPAEVLALHALILGATTTTTTNGAGQAVTTISDPTTLQWSFYGLVLLSVVVYLGGRWRSGSRPARLDIARAMIPPAAFVLWTMLQRSTAFDAVSPSLGSGARYVIALFGAVILGLLASLLAIRADVATSRVGDRSNKG